MNLPLAARPRPGARRRVLGIDPGTRCGFAVVDVTDTARIVTSGTWDLGRGVRRWSLLRGHLQQAIEEHAPDLVAFERVHRHLGTDAAHVYGAIVAFVEYVADEHNRPIAEVKVGTVKQRATGRGNAGKDDVQTAAAQLLPDRRVPSPDEADAIFVALAAADAATDGVAA